MKDSEQQAAKVLVVDDSRFFLNNLQQLLAANGYGVEVCEDGLSALEAAARFRPALILLDVSMPDIDGIETCKRLKSDPKTESIPVVFISNSISSEIRLNCLRSGGEDFVTKPFIDEEILAVLRKVLRRVSSTSNLIDRIKVLEVDRDHLQERLAEARPVTTLSSKLQITDSNRLSVISDIDAPLVDFAKQNHRFALVYMAVDNMDRVDMLFGSDIVFEFQAFLFNQTVQFLKNSGNDLNAIRISRNLADDLVLFLPESGGDRQRLDSERLAAFCRELHLRLTTEMRERFFKPEVASIVNVSVGGSMVLTSSRLSLGRQIVNALRDAQDDALNYQNRARRLQFNRLRDVIGRKDVYMLYQPIVRVRDHAILAYEALARANDEELRMPQLLFDVAEASGLIHDLSRLCRQNAIQAFSSLSPDQAMFLNFHPDDFEDEQLLLDSPDEALFKADASRVVIEVTERCAIKQPHRFRQTVDHLRELGFRIAIDDLGSGYTSLGLIASLNPEFIKFDMSLIRGIDTSTTQQALLRTLTQFTSDIGAQSVAEGVETREEYEVVKEFNCDLIQGYYFAKPDRNLIPHLQLQAAR